MAKKLPVLCTARQAQAVRRLVKAYLDVAPHGDNHRSVTWPEIEIAQRLAYNIEEANNGKRQV